MLSITQTIEDAFSPTFEAWDLARTLPHGVTSRGVVTESGSFFAFHQDRYELLEHIGTGAMATVWRALDRRTRREVAVKLVRTEDVNDADMQRLAREVTTLSELNHPCIVNLLDTGASEKGMPFLVLELVRGMDLRTKLAKQPLLPTEDVADIINQIGAALHHAHDRGVLHLDVKPENVMLLAPEHLEAKLTDFGLARKLANHSASVDPTVVCGTPLYMSPELVLGRTLTPASDVYALAVMAYELLAGRTPHEGSNPVTVMMRHANEAPTPIPEVHTEVQMVLRRGLEKDPALRPDARELAHDLAHALKRHPHRHLFKAYQEAA